MAVREFSKGMVVDFEKLRKKNLRKKDPGQIRYEQRKAEYRKKAESRETPGKLSIENHPLTGVRNPYAIILTKHNSRLMMNPARLAGIKKEHEPDPLIPQVIPDVVALSKMMTREHIASYLNKPVKIKDDEAPCAVLTYDKLFDPAFRSPLFTYCTKIQKDDQSCQNGDAKKIWTKADNPNYADCKTILNQWGGCNLDIKRPGDDTFLVTDPVQGPYPDCYLVAALSSLCWIYPWPVLAGIFSQIISFGDPQYNPYCEVPFSQNYPLDSSTTFLGGKTPKTEIWPYQFEYAFSNFLQAPRWSNTTNPDLCQMNKGSPLYALQTLTFTDAFQRVDMQGDGSDSDHIWNDILNDAGFSYQVGGNSGFDRITQYPTVAWTFTSGDPALTNTPLPPGYNNSNGIAKQGFGVYYDEIIAADHSYSLLGSFTDPNNNEKYVVLRNPWGLNSIYSPAPANWPPNASRYEISTGRNLDLGNNVMQPLTYKIATGACNIIGINNGVFALRFSDFLKYFSGFGWVTG